jgi:hypothetical protein
VTGIGLMLPAVLAVGAGAAAGWALYRAIEVSDLVLRQRVVGSLDAARVRTLGERAWALVFRLWGPGSEDVCRSVHMDPTLLLRIQLALSAAPLLLLGVVLGWPWPVVIGVSVAVFVVIPRAILNSEVSDRRARILNELPDTLGPILEAVQLTGDPVQGIRAGLPYTDPAGPLREEFTRVLAETSAEHDFPGAIERWAERVGHPLARDVARILVVGFERRLHADALRDVRDKLAAIRVMIVEAATAAIPNYMAAAGGALFMGYAALLAIPGYVMLHSGLGFL